MCWVLPSSQGRTASSRQKKRKHLWAKSVPPCAVAIRATAARAFSSRIPDPTWSASPLHVSESDKFTLAHSTAALRHVRLSSNYASAAEARSCSCLCACNLHHRNQTPRRNHPHHSSCINYLYCFCLYLAACLIYPAYERVASFKLLSRSSGSCSVLDSNYMLRFESVWERGVASLKSHGGQDLEMVSDGCICTCT